MRLSEIIEKTGWEVVGDGDPDRVEIERVYSGDRISDLLNAASDKTLLVTGLSGAQLMRLAELMDVRAICLVHGAAVNAEMLRAAASHGLVILKSPFDMFETCGRLFQCFHPAPAKTS